MPQPSSHTPQFFYVQVTDAGVTVTFPAIMGTVLVQNSGATNRCWMAVGAVAPPAAFGDGAKSVRPSGSVNLNNVQLTQLSFRTVLGQTTDLEIIAWPSGD